MTRLRATRDYVRGAVAAERHRLTDMYTRSAGYMPAAALVQVDAMDRLLDDLDGVDLTVSEWHTVAWLIGWDACDRVASIVAKVRAAASAASNDPAPAICVRVSR